MPVGKLLTRLTNDVDALSEVFGSGAVGVIADFVITEEMIKYFIRKNSSFKSRYILQLYCF